MKVGIYLKDCSNVELINNRFHNIAKPVVARGVSNLLAEGNIATYDSSLNEPTTVGLNLRLKALVTALRGVYRVR